MMHVIFLLAAISLIPGRAAPALPPEGAAPALPPEPARWQLLIIAEKSTLIMGEPLRLDFLLRNVGTRTQFAWESNIELEISGGGADRFQHTPNPSAGTYCVAGTPVKAWGEWSLTLVVLFHQFNDAQRVRKGSLVFPHPGTYQVRARYSDSTNEQLEFEDKIQVHVREAGGRDAEAWKLYDDKDVLRFVQFMGDRQYRRPGQGDANPRVERLMKEYPESTYGQILRKIKVDPPTVLPLYNCVIIDKNRGRGRQNPSD